MFQQNIIRCNLQYSNYSLQIESFDRWVAGKTIATEQSRAIRVIWVSKDVMSEPNPKDIACLLFNQEEFVLHRQPLRIRTKNMVLLQNVLNRELVDPGVKKSITQVVSCRQGTYMSYLTLTFYGILSQGQSIYMLLLLILTM